MFLGEDLLPLLVLAIGGAMVVGPTLALIRPRDEHKEGELERAPVGRSLVFIAIGLIGAVWALATLLS
jgi:hypothetical protein